MIRVKDIPDSAFLAVVRAHNTGIVPDKVIHWGPAEGRVVFPPDFTVTGPRWALVWDVAEILDLPEPLVRAKARSLIKRGLMTGCGCGCRGDFEVDGLVTG